jgi:hypothetical protein
MISPASSPLPVRLPGQAIPALSALCSSHCNWPFTLIWRPVLDRTARPSSARNMPVTTNKVRHQDHTELHNMHLGRAQLMSCPSPVTTTQESVLANRHVRRRHCIVMKFIWSRGRYVRALMNTEKTNIDDCLQLCATTLRVTAASLLSFRR